MPKSKSCHQTEHTAFWSLPPPSGHWDHTQIGWNMPPGFSLIPERQQGGTIYIPFPLSHLLMPFVCSPLGCSGVSQNLLQP